MPPSVAYVRNVQDCPLRLPCRGGDVAFCAWLDLIGSEGIVPCPPPLTGGNGVPAHCPLRRDSALVVLLAKEGAPPS